MSQQAFEEVVVQSESLRAHIEAFRARAQQPQNLYGEAAIDMAASPEEEAYLPGTYVDYETSPREYHSSLLQTVFAGADAGGGSVQRSNASGSGAVAFDGEGVAEASRIRDDQQP
jgi:hypothetical protein